MLSNIKPHKAGLLISEPFMLDPNFKRSVVFIADHSEAGTVGYVMNHRSDVVLGDLIPECAASNLPVYLGGPVGNETLHFLHRCYDKMHSGTEVGKGVFWGGDFETIKTLVNEGSLNSEEVRFFVGYSGWERHQLDEELKQNAWMVSNKYPPRDLFKWQPEEFWKNAVLELGPRYAHIINFPETPMWN